MNVLLFGATGAVGGGVLRACLAAKCVNSVTLIGRRAAPVTNAKIQSVSHADFNDFSAVASSFDNVNACFFCIGTSKVFTNGDEFRAITVEYPLSVQRTLLQRSPSASFHYVTARGTNANSFFRLARVKGEAENALRAQSKLVNCYRPGMVDSVGDFGFFTTRVAVPFFRAITKRSRDWYLPDMHMGYAMLQSCLDQNFGNIFENGDIRDLADAVLSRPDAI
eukprot:TRINITY_DN7682_c0_g1_i1.p1 TRINITY_DN7682_c0_g1~~TRINITY_DN7682_c0_g1_i1.p1  ORF type:complete len:222 (-),score=26.57 TRINITY_DN7682_c0_g1_i1:240-905(-)